MGPLLLLLAVLLVVFFVVIGGAVLLVAASAGRPSVSLYDRLLGVEHARTATLLLGAHIVWCISSGCCQECSRWHGRSGGYGTKVGINGPVEAALTLLLTRTNLTWQQNNEKTQTPRTLSSLLLAPVTPNIPIS